MAIHQGIQKMAQFCSPADTCLLCCCGQIPSCQRCLSSTVLHQEIKVVDRPRPRPRPIKNLVPSKRRNGFKCATLCYSVLLCATLCYCVLLCATVEMSQNCGPAHLLSPTNLEHAFRSVLDSSSFDLLAACDYKCC